MNTAYFIARRFYKDNKDKKHFSRPAVRIAMWGIAIGLAVMIISICVVKGFQREVSNKVIGFGSHIQVLNLTLNDNEALPIITTDSLKKALMGTEGVVGIQRYSTKTGMMKTDEEFMGLTFKGIGEDYDMTFLTEYLKEGEKPKFSSKKSGNKILISSHQANMLHLKVGDKVFAYFISNNEEIRTRRFTVSGIYETSLTEYDKTFAFTDLYTINKLNKWEENEATAFELKVNDFDKVTETTDRLIDKLSGIIDKRGCRYGAFSIKEMAPGIFAWLDVLDMNVIMILILMLFVSSFTVISGLLIIMLERINTIGTLKALGSSNFTIRKIFIYFAIMLVGKGMLIGNIIGLGLCLIQKLTHIIKLDSSTYYISSVPIRFNWLYIIGVNVLTLVISSLVIFGSSYFISLRKPVETINYE